MSDNHDEQPEQNKPEQNHEQNAVQQQKQQLTQADKKVYDEIFSNLKKMDKKVKNAQTKLKNQDQNKKSQQNTAFKQIAEKLIESKQNSEIINKQDLSSDISQSFQRTVIDIYSQNQKLKKKQTQMEKIIKQQNHKIFEHLSKQQNYIKEIQKLKFQLAQIKDQNLMADRSGLKTQAQTQTKKQSGKKGVGKYESNSNQDYDFWNMPQNDNNYGKKKKQFVQNSGLWVNQKNINDSMFITQGRR